MLSTYTTLRPPEISGKNQMQGVRYHFFAKSDFSWAHRGISASDPFRADFLRQ